MWMRSRLAWLILVLCLGGMGSYTEAGNRFGELSPESESERIFGATVGGYISSGCQPALPAASLTVPAFSCIAMVPSPDTPPRLTPAIQTTPDSLAMTNVNGSHWVAMHTATSGNVGPWVRRAGTHYLVQQSATRPPPPTAGMLVLRVEVAGGAITAIAELGARRMTKPETSVTSRLIDPSALWIVESGARLTVPPAVTVSHQGAVQAPCRSGEGWIELTGSGLLRFDGVPSVCPQWWGAYSDGTVSAQTAVAINQAIESLSTRGGEVYFPKGTYMIAGITPPGRAIWVRHANITLSGAGPASIIQATTNSDTLICVARTADCSYDGTASVANVTIHHLRLKGTGTPQDSGITTGRCILAPQAIGLRIHDNLISDCSMIGISIHAFDGKFSSVHRNYVSNAGLRGIHVHGQATQSIVAHNIIDLIPRVPQHPTLPATCIQVTGHVLVDGNMCSNIDGIGIQHGPTDFHGITILTNNLIKTTTAQGIAAQDHGPVKVVNNTIINSLGGMTIQGEVGLFPGRVVQDCQIQGNFILNSPPGGIAVSSPDCLIAGNMIDRELTPGNAAGVPETVITDPGPYTFGIHIVGSEATVYGNTVNGAAYGLAIWNGLTRVHTGHNTFRNLSVGEVAAVNSAGVPSAVTAQAVKVGARMVESGTAIPTSGPVRAHGWQVDHQAPTSGQPLGWINTSHVATTTTGASTGTTLQVDSTAGMTTSHRVMVVNSPGDYTARYRAISAVVDATTLSLDSALSVVAGEIVYADRFVPLANVP